MVRIKRHMHLGVSAFLAATTIGQASASAASLMLFPILRTGLLALAVVFFAIYHLRGKARTSNLFSLALIVFLFAYGLIVTALQGSSSYSIPYFFQSFLIIFFGIFFYSVSAEEENRSKVAINQIWFAILILAFLAITGAIVFDFPPYFVYDIYVEGGQVTYNQGTSSFFGIAALSSLFLLKASAGRAHQSAMLVLFFVFVLISLLGGGRGEILFLLVASLHITFHSGLRGIVLGLVAILLIATFFTFADLGFLDDLEIYKRFLVIFLNSDYGLRDVLFSQAIDLLLNDNRCFFFGCGFGAFQSHYQYPPELYPHNILLEALLTWGVPITALVIILFFVGLVRGRSAGALNYFGFYSVLVGMKSGDILGSWLAFSFIFFYASTGFILLVRRRASGVALDT
ncbi:hypothetical protein [Shimia sp. FJ5]|uniref:hypothetical protein n=1 Tax=Shimia sp. FJ5 TaxID=3079054 RepID=UPI00293DF054|nr:hypothetical protein [Shimia sp. FJ5]MDV4144357.1 hypothetical protein [Shimia sp. FJ5]